METRTPDTTATAGTVISYLIIGGGLAGISAAEAIRTHGGAAGRIVIVTTDTEAPYHRPPLSKEYLRAEQERKEVFVQPPEWYHENGVELMRETRAVSLDPAARVITLDNGRELHYEKLLLATGGTPQPLGIPGEELDGVLSLRSLADADALRKAAAKAKRAVIVGGGFIGVEAAAAMAHYKVETTLLVRGEHVWSAFATPETAQFIEETLTDHGIKIVKGETPARILPQQGKQHAGSVATKGGRTLGGDLVVGAVGITPDIALAQAAGLTIDDETGGVRVDDHLRTSDPAIYAAGDIASFPDPTTGKLRRVEHWDTALTHGQTAGANMAGADDAYTHVQYFFSDLFDLGIEVLGNPDPALETITRGAIADRSFAVLYLDPQEIVVGAFTVNRPAEELDQYRVLIEQRASLAGFEQEAAEHPDEDLTGLVADLETANEELNEAQQTREQEEREAAEAEAAEAREREARLEAQIAREEAEENGTPVVAAVPDAEPEPAEEPVAATRE